MVRRRQHMRFQLVPKQSCDGFPTVILRIAGDQIRETARAASCHFYDDAAIVRAVHVLDMRRKQLEIKIVGEAREMTLCELIETDRKARQWCRCSAPELLLLVNKGKHPLRLSTVFIVFRVHYPVRPVLPQDD